MSEQLCHTYIKLSSKPNTSNHSVTLSSIYKNHIIKQSALWARSALHRISISVRQIDPTSGRDNIDKVSQVAQVTLALCLDNQCSNRAIAHYPNWSEIWIRKLKFVLILLFIVIIAQWALPRSLNQTGTLSSVTRTESSCNNVIINNVLSLAVRSDIYITITVSKIQSSARVGWGALDIKTSFLCHFWPDQEQNATNLVLICHFKCHICN